MATPTRERWLQLTTAGAGAIEVRVVDVARARHLRLTLGRDGPRLSKPRWLPLRDAAAFLDEKRDWLEARLNERAQRRGQVALPSLLDGQVGHWPLRGRVLPLTVVAGTRPQLCLSADGSAAELHWPTARTPSPGVLGGLFRAVLDAQMRSDIAGLLAHYIPILGRAPTRLSLRPLQSLWGSLSARDHLSLDLALILAPPRLLEYVLVHELCHLFERNHSPRFWARVADLMPDFRQHQHHLRQDGDGYKSDLTALLRATTQATTNPGLRSPTEA